MEYPTIPIDKIIINDFHNEKLSQHYSDVFDTKMYPVIIDKDFNLKSGLGRLNSAKKNGINSIPYEYIEEKSKSFIRNGPKDIQCSDCKIELSVRKDTKAQLCHRCTSARAGKSVKGQERTPRSKCKVCEKTFRKSLNYTFCSTKCRNEFKTVVKKCKKCKKDFKIYKSALSKKTNSSGNFCSRLCYEDFMCDTERVKNYGCRWKKIRDAVVKKTPFCAICGTFKKLDVHHIMPYRLTKDNSESNLIPLCKKHHKFVESITNDILLVDRNNVKKIMGNILFSQQLVTRSKLMEIIREKS